MNQTIITIVIPSVIRLSLLATVESIKIQDMKPDIKLVFGDNVSEQRNYGAQNCKTEYILFTDDDVILQRDCLKNLISEMETNNLDVVFASIRGSFNSNEKNPFSGAGIFCRSEVLDHIKFDENIKVSEDIDFGWQLIEAGYKWMYTEEAVIYHLRELSKHEKPLELARKWPERYKYLVENHSSIME